QLAVDSAGNAWAVQDSGYIYQWNGSTWVSIPGLATDVAAGTGGSVYALGTTGTAQGGYIYKYVGGTQTWQYLGGAVAVQIAVAPDGLLWARQADGSIYRYNGATWTAIPGFAFELSAGGPAFS